MRGENRNEFRSRFRRIKTKNPVTVASGTFGYGREYSDFYDLGKLGAVITKGTSLKPRNGNKPSRVCETPSGMLKYRATKSRSRIFCSK